MFYLSSFNSFTSFWFYYDVSVWTGLVEELFVLDVRSGHYMYFLNSLIRDRNYCVASLPDTFHSTVLLPTRSANRYRKSVRAISQNTGGGGGGNTPKKKNTNNPHLHVSPPPHKRKKKKKKVGGQKKKKGGGGGGSNPQMTNIQPKAGKLVNSFLSTTSYRLLRLLILSLNRFVSGLL